MPTQEEYLKYKNFVQKITSKPAPIEDQPHKREGLFLWCEDWELIELGKFLFMGKSTYLGDPPPRRLKFNPLFNQEKIISDGEALLNKYNGDAEKIIQSLEERRRAYTT